MATMARLANDSMYTTVQTRNGRTEVALLVSPAVFDWAEQGR